MIIDISLCLQSYVPWNIDDDDDDDDVGGNGNSSGDAGDAIHTQNGEPFGKPI